MALSLSAWSTGRAEDSTIGLSATQRPLEEVARFLGGAEGWSEAALVVEDEADLSAGLQDDEQTLRDDEQTLHDSTQK